MSKQKAAKKPEPPADTATIPMGELAGAASDGARFMVHLTVAATKMIDTACLVDSMDRSQVIEDLIRTHLAAYFSGKTVPSVIENAEV